MDERFEKLFGFIPRLKDESTDYDQLIDEYIRDAHAFVVENPEYELDDYGKILEENGIRWGQRPIEEADVSKLDAKACLGLLTAAWRADRINEGALLGFMKSGAILKWLERLKELQENEE